MKSGDDGGGVDEGTLDRGGERGGEIAEEGTLDLLPGVSE